MAALSDVRLQMQTTATPKEWRWLSPSEDGSKVGVGEVVVPTSRQMFTGRIPRVPRSEELLPAVSFTLATMRMRSAEDYASATPTLSVIIACRDAERVLGLQLRALSVQTCPVPWELVVCDDGSTDRTVELCTSWAGRLPLRVVRPRSRGEVRRTGRPRAAGWAGTVLNAGVRAARGEWIAFCPADMEVGSGWLETLCAGLAEYDLVIGRFVTERARSGHVLNRTTTSVSRWSRDFDAAGGMPDPGPGNLAVRRAIFTAAEGFDPSVAHLQGTDLCWRVQRAGGSIRCTSRLTMHARLNVSGGELFGRAMLQAAWYAELRRRHSGPADRHLSRAAGHGAAARPMVDWPATLRTTLGRRRSRTRIESPVEPRQLRATADMPPESSLVLPTRRRD